MSKRNLLSVFLFCLAFVSLCAQNSGNGSGHGTPPKIPIEIILKGEDVWLMPGTTIINSNVEINTGQ